MLVRLNRARPAIWLVSLIAVSTTACGGDEGPDKCTSISEVKGEEVARKSIMRFLRYAGKTHTPISGDGATLDMAKLERMSENDLIYDKRQPAAGSTYAFHLLWAPNVKFTATVAPDCTATPNWSVN